MIFDKLACVVSMLPATCFCLIKSAQNNMNAFGGRGMYPWDSLFPGGHLLRVGGCVGAVDGGNSREVRA